MDPWKSSPSAGTNISKRCSALSARRREPREPSANRTVSWPPNSSSAACPWLPSKTHWFWPRRAGSCVLPELRRWARFVPWHTSRQSSKKCWSCASNKRTSSICAIGSNASPKRVADSPARRNPTPQPASGGDDMTAPRTPAAWMILLASLSHQNTRLRRG